MIGNLGWIELLLLPVLLFPVAMPFYLLRRYVRALERRADDRTRIRHLTSEIRALGAEVALMKHEIESVADGTRRTAIESPRTDRTGT